MIDFQLERDIAYGCRMGRLVEPMICSGEVVVAVRRAGVPIGLCMKHYLHNTDLTLIPLKELIVAERTKHAG